MSQLEISKSHYDHVFWAMATGVALMFWWVTTRAPQFAHIAGYGILVAVLAGWLTAMWRGAAFGGVVAESRPPMVSEIPGS